uniref:GC-rich sequence DNA-binding factor 2 n=1 Tax=Sphenodon punctatus TaxID=8508 RepID=A0A8D0HDF5_SPHPU
MFRKPPRRNFRGRRRAGSSSSSSEAEPEPEPSSGCQGEPREAERDPDRPHRRRGARPARAEEDGSAAGLGSEAPPPLSFREGDERDGDEEHFKIKKPAVNTITFRTQKKENPDSASKQNETSQANVQSEFGTLNTKHNSEEDEEDEHNSSASVDYSSSTSGSQSSSSPDREDFSAGKIPDAATTLPLRRKRQLARSQGNYIPLNTSHGDRLFQQKGSSDSESEDESDKKIHFAPRTKSLRERMSEHIVSRGSETSEESQDDDAQNKWEEQQIKKAIKLHKVIYSFSASMLLLFAAK